MEEKKKKTLLYLPQELITLILLRLPVKSLTRFKCVCKSWFSLISNPHFANSHFQLSAATPTRRILLLSASAPRESKSIDFKASSLGDPVSLYPKFMPFQSYSRIKIKGSCRGFLLLHCFNKQSWIYEIYIMNPSTGFHKKIPLSPFASHSGIIQYYTDFYGFGYDHATDDYLLVTMSSEVRPPHLEFFSLRANTWKEIEGAQFPYRNIMGIEQPRVGFLFNGAIHWFAYYDDLREYVIVAFDLMEKKLFNMHLPVDFDRERNQLGLWVFGEFLSIWVVYYGDVHDNSTLEVWVMKEYKVDSPWTKTFVLPLGGTTPKNFRPICSTKSGDIIGTDGHTELEKYNDQGQLLEYHSYFNGRCGWQVALYIESLLSLPGNEQA
ncbi:F-box/kelch-repeat protein [Trifolium repens]|jgi:F-box interacting protein|nr:F-box/kelch-repeat protein [Trifolium repens]